MTFLALMVTLFMRPMAMAVRNLSTLFILMVVSTPMAMEVRTLPTLQILMAVHIPNATVLCI